MHNAFFDGEDYRREVPRRTFALYDQHEERRVLLEAVDADWLGEELGRALNPEAGLRGWAEILPRAPIAVIETNEEIFPRWNLKSPVFHDREDEDGGPRDWVEIGLNAGGGDDGLVYMSLFAEGVPVGFDYMKPVEAKLAAALDGIFDLSPYRATAGQIRAGLQPALLSSPVEWVGVYDVGQGSANALCDKQGMPMAYFDLGGGVLANKATFPAAMTGICLTRDPPVILSHWDWDHWSTATRFPQSTTMTWLVPDQRLGAVHGTLAATIVANGELLVWPLGLPDLKIGRVKIEKCLGASGRNNTGLALLVEGPAGMGPILLTGDARYPAIPSGLIDCHAVVVPHHGADMHNAAIPDSVGHTASRAAYSYGSGNTFSHPRNCTYQQHQAHAWPHRCYVTSGAVDRHTADQRPGLGHIALGWSSTRHLPVQGCGGRYCSLQLVQQ